jgi:hypothetical protein
MSERGRSHDVLSFEKFSISNSPTPNRERNAVIDFDSDLDVGGGGGGAGRKTLYKTKDTQNTN